MSRDATLTDIFGACGDVTDGWRDRAARKIAPTAYLAADCRTRLVLAVMASLA